LEIVVEDAPVDVDNDVVQVLVFVGISKRF